MDEYVKSTHYILKSLGFNNQTKCALNLNKHKTSSESDLTCTLLFCFQNFLYIVMSQLMSHYLLSNFYLNTLVYYCTLCTKEDNKSMDSFVGTSGCKINQANRHNLEGTRLNTIFFIISD